LRQHQVLKQRQVAALQLCLDHCAVPKGRTLWLLAQAEQQPTPLKPL
jgi:hypothetical protein